MGKNKCIVFQLGILILITLNSCSNKSTLYCTAPNFSAWCYEFKPNQEFNYDFGTCTGSSYGYGNYEILGDTIRFKFDDTPDPQQSKIEAEQVGVLKDSININLMVNNFRNGKPIAFCTVAVFNKGLLVAGFETDTIGTTQFTLESNDLGYEVQLSYIGMESYRFITSSKGLYNVKIDLHQAIGNRKKGYTEEYRLIELSDSLFIYSSLHDPTQIIRLGRKEEK